MPIIYSYPPITNPLAEDTFVLTRTIEDENRIETRSVSYDDLRKRMVKDSTFVFEQGVAATTWDIVHSMGKYPSVEVVDTQDTSILGFKIEYINVNRLIITFLISFAGKAFLN